MTWVARNLNERKNCFFGCDGGVSKGKYKGLNVNTRSQDNKNNIAKNLEIAAAKIGVKKDDLLLLNQGVSNIAVYVEKASQDKIEADGAVTDVENIALCIRTADCAPVLFRDDKAKIIGAAHAGWRGAYKGIIENVVNLMIEKGAKIENIAAAVGPCIGQKSYEVDEGFYCQFVSETKENEKYFIKGIKEGFYQFDLQEFCVDKLKKTGVKNIEVANHDTYAMKDNYYSFRRFTHCNMVDNPKDFATELSVIVL